MSGQRSPIDLLWFLPSAGDQRFLASTIGARPASREYPRHVQLPDAWKSVPDPSCGLNRL